MRGEKNRGRCVPGGNQPVHPAGVPVSCISRVSPVMPSACGRDEVYHLKCTCLIDSMSIIAGLFFPVKSIRNFFVPEQPSVLLFICLHECNNRVFKSSSIFWCDQPQCQSNICMRLPVEKALQAHGSVWPVILYNIIWVRYNFWNVLHICLLYTSRCV